MSEPSLQQGLNQRMVATATMQLGVNVLQANALELRDIVQQALESNPVLDEERPEELAQLNTSEDSSRDDASDSELDDDWTSQMAPEARLDTDDGNDWDSSTEGWDGLPTESKVWDAEALAHHDHQLESISHTATLAEHLQEQAFQEGLAPQVERALLALIDLLDERGYFATPPESVEEDLGIPMQVYHEALQALRSLDPPGVGARDLQDCLLIQLDRSGEKRSLTTELVSKCWTELAKHKYEDAATKLGVSLDDIRVALERITRLSPNPGADFGEDTNLEIVPDLIAEEQPDGSVEVTLTNRYVPKLKLNSAYKETYAEGAGSPELLAYLKKSIREGRELIQAISQRQETILRIARVIVRKQLEYFLHGPKSLAPLGMESVADELGIHISTVSRAVSGKFIRSKWGCKELRSFFSTAISTVSPTPTSQDTDSPSLSDSALAPEAVQSIMRDLIASESPAKPYSDAALTKELNRLGIQIARRTVAKYRELLKILPASLRKKI